MTAIFVKSLEWQLHTGSTVYKSLHKKNKPPPVSSKREPTLTNDCLRKEKMIQLEREGCSNLDHCEETSDKNRFEQVSFCVRFRNSTIEGTCNIYFAALWLNRSHNRFG